MWLLLRKEIPLLLEVGGTVFDESCEVADVFAEYFCPVYNTPCQGYVCPFRIALNLCQFCSV
jgi:hypothetical protein